MLDKVGRKTIENLGKMKFFKDLRKTQISGQNIAQKNSMIFDILITIKALFISF